MRRNMAVAGHASMLALLVAGAGYAVGILVSNVVMLIGTAVGHMSIAEMGPGRSPSGC